MARIRKLGQRERTGQRPSAEAGPDQQVERDAPDKLAEMPKKSWWADACACAGFERAAVDRAVAGLDAVRRIDRGLTRRVAAWDSPWARRVLPAVESAAEHTKLWWAAAALSAAVGGPKGRRAAVAGLASMAVAELVSNGVCKPLYERRRPPKNLIPHEDVDDRPDSSSFPSGHTAAAIGFTAAVARTSPRLGAVCAGLAAMVAVERVHTGAHYPSDVVAGAAIGLASAQLVHHVPRLLLRKTV